MPVEKEKLQLPSIPDQIVGAVRHLQGMSRRAKATFEEHADSERAVELLLRRFKTEPVTHQNQTQ